MFLFFQVKCMADNNEFKKTTILQGTERKCPNCGGTLTYNARARAMFCSLCGKVQEIEESPDNNKVEGIEYNDLFNSNRAALGDKCKPTAVLNLSMIPHRYQATVRSAGPPILFLLPNREA